MRRLILTASMQVGTQRFSSSVSITRAPPCLNRWKFSWIDKILTYSWLETAGTMLSSSCANSTLTTVYSIVSVYSLIVVLILTQIRITNRAPSFFSAITSMAKLWLMLSAFFSTKWRLNQLLNNWKQQQMRWKSYAHAAYFETRKFSRKSFWTTKKAVILESTK